MTYRLPRPIGSNQNCERTEESDNLLIFVLYSKTPHAKNTHLFDPGHVCECFLSQHQGPRDQQGLAGRPLQGKGREAPGERRLCWKPSSHTGFLPGWRARAGGCRPGDAHGRQNTNPGTPRPCPLTDSRLGCPAGHVSRVGLRAFTPQSRGTPGSGRPAVRAQLWLPGAVPPKGVGCWDGLRVAVDSGSLLGTWTTLKATNSEGPQTAMTDSGSQRVILGFCNGGVEGCGI